MSEGPDYQLEIMRVRYALDQQRTSLTKQYLDKMEAVSRIRQADENITAHKKSIKDYEGKLENLEKTHGELGPPDVDKLAEEQLVKSNS